MCDMIFSCTENDNTHVEVKTKHEVNIPCSDPRIKDVVAAVEKAIKQAIGDWPGSVTAILDQCLDKSGKRQSSSTVDTNVIFDGPYAGSTAEAAADIMNPNLDTGTGVQGSLQSSETSFSENDEGLSGGAIAGIVVGCVVAVTLVLVGVAIALTKANEADKI